MHMLSLHLHCTVDLTKKSGLIPSIFPLVLPSSLAHWYITFTLSSLAYHLYTHMAYRPGKWVYALIPGYFPIVSPNSQPHTRPSLHVIRYPPRNMPSTLRSLGNTLTMKALTFHESPILSQSLPKMGEKAPPSHNNFLPVGKETGYLSGPSINPTWEFANFGVISPTWSLAAAMRH